MAKKFLPRALSVGLSLALCASMVAPSFAASFTELQKAINTGKSVYQEDGTSYKIEASKDENGAVNVKLHEDVTNAEKGNYITISGDKNVTINLNGNDIVDTKENTKGYAVLVNGTNASLTVTDSSEGGSGAIKGNSGQIIYNNGGALNLNGGTVEATSGTGKGVYAKGGTTTIGEDAVVKGGNVKKSGSVYGVGIYASGGTVNTSGDVSGYIGIFGSNGKVNVSDGQVTSESSYGIYASTGNETKITRGEVIGKTQGVHIGNGGKATIDGEDVIIKGTEAGIGVYGSGKEKASELIVKDGTVIGDRYGITGNGSTETGADYSNTKIIVEGGTVTGGNTGIYHPQDGALTIGKEGSKDGPTITGTSGNGVQVCAGETTIYGGTIKGSGEDSTEDKVGDGVIPDGSAVSAVSRKGYGKEENRTNGYSQPKVTIHVDHVNMNPNDTTFQWENKEDPGQKPADWSGDGEDSGIVNVNHVWGAWEPVTAPTCHTVGSQVRHCEAGCEETGELGLNPINHDGGTEVRGAYAATNDTPGYTGDTYCLGCGALIRRGEPIAVLTEIDEPEVPLAGIFTRADAIGYLWEQAGEPEWELSDFPDVPEDHEWAVAIGWAQDMGIALPDLEGNFRPDDLVLRSVESLEISPEGELQEFLNRYAVYAGVELNADELFIELEGTWDDVIMGEDAQVIFDEFFAKLEAALNAAA